MLAGSGLRRRVLTAASRSIAAKHPFEYMQSWLTERIELDPGFKECFDWFVGSLCRGGTKVESHRKLTAFFPFATRCEAQTPKVPVVIVSSGMVPIIRSIMEKLVGVEAASRIDIIANEVDHRADGTWGIKVRHPPAEKRAHTGTVPG